MQKKPIKKAWNHSETKIGKSGWFLALRRLWLVLQPSWLALLRRASVQFSRSIMGIRSTESFFPNFSSASYLQSVSCLFYITVIGTISHQHVLSFFNSFLFMVILQHRVNFFFSNIYIHLFLFPEKNSNFLIGHFGSWTIFLSS